MERAELVPHINHQTSSNGLISASAASTDMHLTGKATTPEHVPSCILQISFLAFVNAKSLHDSATPTETHCKGVESTLTAPRCGPKKQQSGSGCYAAEFGLGRFEVKQLMGNRSSSRFAHDALRVHISRPELLVKCKYCMPCVGSSGIPHN